ncbi:transmembrane 248 [Pelobates cultripes]|uniref:Transmembrane protein 248 n=3 Tax=Pelobates cultripes TaxID=61616 RepID=A0AAD1QYH6_PELCU|nr:transmembrane 248 [Pelobates cultripes]
MALHPLTPTPSIPSNIRTMLKMLAEKRHTRPHMVVMRGDTTLLEAYTGHNTGHHWTACTIHRHVRARGPATYPETGRLRAGTRGQADSADIAGPAGYFTMILSLHPLENLKAYISSRPPLVVFMVSVSGMAIAFLTLGYFFKMKEIKSPEMTEDWNTFLLRFNNLDLCISENETLKHLLNDTTPPESTVTTGQARSSTQTPQALEDSGPINISVAVTLTLDPLKPFGGLSRNVTHLSSTIFGHQIGLSGRDSHEEMNITFTLPAAWNSDDCILHGRCEQVGFTTCMTVTAASSVFPVTLQPPHCIPETYSNATLWYKIFTTARDSRTKYAQDYNPFWCYKGAIGKVYHTLNPKLTVIVPEDDRSLINLHLMDTSYFLFVMVITMFCYAVIRGRPSKIRQSNSEFSPEKVALSDA